MHKTQQLVHSSKARFKVLKCGRRWGKTVLKVFELVQRANATKDGIFWYVGPTYGQTKEIAWNVLKRMVPSDLLQKKPSESDLSMLFWNGSIIKLKGSDYPESLKGVPLDGVAMDEAGFQQEAVWNEILRPQLMDKHGFCDFISTPNGTNWFTNLYNEAKRRKESGDAEWDYFHFTTYDNPHIDPKEIDVTKDTIPEDKFNQEILAVESSDVGLLYPEFDWNKNTGLYQGVNTLSNVRAIDWGIAHPTVCLFGALDLNEKKLYIEDEYVKSGKIIQESCAAIKEITRNRPIDWSVIDPSCSKRNSQTRRRDMDEFARYGIHCIPADNNERGIDITRMFLKHGVVKINPKCKTLIYQLRNLNRGQDEGDDAADCLRYMCLRVHDYVHGMNIKDLMDGLKEFKPGDPLRLAGKVEWTITMSKMAAADGEPVSKNGSWVRNHIATL